MSKHLITSDMAQHGGICPVCLRYFTPNGVGPEANKMLATVLDNLPSSHLLRYGANYHDWAYHMGDLWGSRLEADNLMVEKNEEKIKRECSVFTTWFYRAMNRRNYLFVREFGSSFWGKDGCKEKNKVAAV